MEHTSRSEGLPDFSAEDIANLHEVLDAFATDFERAGLLKRYRLRNDREFRQLSKTLKRLRGLGVGV